MVGGIIISALIGAAISGAVAGTTTAINRKRFTRANDKSMESNKKYLDEQNANEMEDLNAQIARDDEKSRNAINQASLNFQETTITSRDKRKQANDAVVGQSINSIVDNFSNNSSRLFGQRAETNQKWGL